MNLLLLKTVIGWEVNFGKAKMSLTSATKATSSKDQLSEFVMKQANGQEKSQHVNLKFVSSTLFNKVPEEVFVIFYSHNP